MSKGRLSIEVFESAGCKVLLGGHKRDSFIMAQLVCGLAHINKRRVYVLLGEVASHLVVARTIPEADKLMVFEPVEVVTQS